MVRVDEHLDKIKKTKQQLKTATGYLRNDLLKYLKRLSRELQEYERLSRQ